ncbi:MAG: phosphotransferase [Candidatus Nanoarchaeia archaeon]|nr:phosphotransferase [Candidatus Nanoarchaeia archaeon]
MTLKNSEIKEICSNYNIGDIIKFKKFGQGVVNNNWLIITNKGKFVLRAVNEEKSINNIKSEFKYLNYLLKKGFNYKIPYQLISKTNLLYQIKGNQLFWIYQFIEGTIVKNSFSEKQLKEIAIMLSNLHLIIEKSDLKNIMNNKNFNIKGVINESLEQINESLKEKNEFSKYYYLNAKKLMDIVKNLKYPKLETYPIHRDINPENVVFKKNKLIGVIDFDNVSFFNEPLAKDIATLFSFYCFNKNDKNKLDLNLAKIFIKEYSKIRKLTQTEIKAIPALAIMGCLEDFNYEYWLFKNEPSKTNFEKLKLRFETALWFYANNETIVQELIKCI